MNVGNRMFLCLMCFISCAVQAHTVLTGNSGSSTTTFDFSVGPVSFISGVKGMMASVYTGAGEEKSGNTYAVAQFSNALKGFLPVAVSTAMVNNVADQPNPFTGKKIKFLKYHRGSKDEVLPSLVIDQENLSVPVAQQERFYVVASTSVPKADEPTNVDVKIAQSDIPNDAAGSASGYIEGLIGCKVSSSSFGSAIIGAVTENGQDFGSGNSGIAVAKYSSKDIYGTGATLEMFNCNTGALGNAAVLFNNTIDAVKVGSNATIVTADVSPVVDMHWDGALQRFYIALRVTAAAGADSGARAIVVGRLSNNKLYFDSIIPNIAVTGGSNDNIVAANNTRSASIYKVRTMRTTTGLNYLIVNGGNNEDGVSGMRKVANQVYAVPLTNLNLIGDTSYLTSADQGVAAKVTQDPNVEFNVKGNSRFISRRFRDKATTASQLFTTSSTEAQVGAGTLPLVLPDAPTAISTIQDMFVVDDAVYVTVAQGYDVSGVQIQEPGIFHSHAIFDHKGRIASWTPWTRVGGSDDKTYRAGLDGMRGNLWYTTGASSSSVNTVKKGDWGLNSEDGLLGGTTTDSQVGLINTLTREFKSTDGGVQAFADFDACNNAQGIPHSGLTGITTFLASGNKKFSLIKTGDNSEGTGTIKPYTGDFSTNLASGTNDTFPAGTGRIFTVAGTVISNIGPIVANTVFSNASHSWIAVGGPRGLAILSNSSGQGFLPSGLPTNFTFKKAGNYSFVKKIIGDGTFLYVLTTKTFDRITIDPTRFASGNIQCTTLATPQDLGLGRFGSFSDMVIADKLAVLATNKGMFRIANGSSVKAGRCLWTYVPLNESTGLISSLSFASPSTDFNTGLANKGQLYALSAYQGYDQARLYRFYINEGSAISDTSLQNIGDQYIQGTLTYFASFGQFRGNYVSDGSMRFITRPTDETRSLLLQSLPVSIRTASPFYVGNWSTSIAADLPTSGIIGRVLRSSASGAWLLSGDFGLRVSE